MINEKDIRFNELADFILSADKKGVSISLEKESGLWKLADEQFGINSQDGKHPGITYNFYVDIYPDGDWAECSNHMEIEQMSPDGIVKKDYILTDTDRGIIINSLYDQIEPAFGRTLSITSFSDIFDYTVDPDRYTKDHLEIDTNWDSYDYGDER